MALKDLSYHISIPSCTTGNMSKDEFYAYLTKDEVLGYEIHLQSLKSTLNNLEVNQEYEKCVIVRDYINNINNER